MIKRQLMSAGMLAALTLLFFFSANAQLQVTTSGEVGIGTATPAAKLEIQNATQGTSLRLENTAGVTSMYGIFNVAGNTTTSGTVYGLQNTLSSGNGTIFGIFNSMTQNTAGGSGFMYGTIDLLSSRSDGNNFGSLTIISRSEGNGSDFGLYSTVNGPSSQTSDRYGVYSSVGIAGTGSKYGVYSTVPSGTNQFAGFFDGDVTITGTLTQSSDAHLKENVSEINQALDLVLQLSGKTYTYKQEESALNLPQGTQFGFLAQDLEQVMPGLVKDTRHPGSHKVSAAIDPTGTQKTGDNSPVTVEDTEGEDFKSVNYIGVIPVLVEAIKEQQQLIEAQRARIEALEKKLK